MSNGRRITRNMSAHLTDLLGPLDGARIPGGCHHCDAYQTTHPVEAGVWSITVHHDDWCPVLQRVSSR
jgi:hypothetical protein